MTTAAETEFAPAKINLALHVTGQRADGYHLLDSLVVFAGVSDVIQVEHAHNLDLEVTGPFSEYVPQDQTNLVLRAAELMAGGRTARISLQKNLPPASGIGGGSSDAAATLRALSRIWGTDLPLKDALLSLGADVPVCMFGRPARMQGIGEIITPLSDMPPLHMLFVNPRVSVSTPAVFSRLETRVNPPLPELPAFHSAQDLVQYLKNCRNDLERPACQIEPVIEEVIGQIKATQGCLLARMSGSGATCFGLFKDKASKEQAQAYLQDQRPNWWVAS